MTQVEAITVTGEWLFYLDGQLIRREKNLVVQSGLNFLAALLIGEQTNDIPIHLALGTGTAAPTAADTKLVAEGLPGDSLWAIAKKTLGDGSRWRDIYSANASVISKDLNKIYPGQTLRIPA